MKTNGRPEYSHYSPEEMDSVLDREFALRYVIFILMGI
jgi:hypothetical protein